ncbi:MAG TPA: hypothetical protein VF342_10195 [Alphaproteobacteria bacterium]
MRSVHNDLLVAEPCALDIAQLTFPEQLVLWSIRTWAETPGDAVLIHREMIRACGATSGSLAFAMLRCLLSMLARGGCRPTHCHRLACRVVGADEQAILGLIAASQADDRRYAEAQASQLVMPALRKPFLEAAVLLATTLDEAGWHLPPRYALPRPGVPLH